jgi:hypothetical protein
MQFVNLTHPYRRLWRLAAAGLLALFAAACATTPAPDRVGNLDPQGIIDTPLLREAVESYFAHQKSLRPGLVVADVSGGHELEAELRKLRGGKFVVVDFRKPTTQRRLYIVDWQTGAVEAHFVSHGRGSDPTQDHQAERFTNIPGSGTSSVGAYVGAQPYMSAQYGLALRLIGVDATNSNALGRAIVVHKNPRMFDEKRVLSMSCGCFITSPEVNDRLVDILREGGFLYAGPASLFEATTASVARECNPECGCTPDGQIASEDMTGPNVETSGAVTSAIVPQPKPAALAAPGTPPDQPLQPAPVPEGGPQPPANARPAAAPSS